MSNTNWFAGDSSFKSACRAVRGELKRYGFWCDKLAVVPVRQVPVGLAYGWQYYRGCGDIVIPQLSFIRVFDRIRGVAISLRDTIRHEYAHAFAHTREGFSGSDKFITAFGRPHDSLDTGYYEKDLYVSPYAANDASEDFAETFMFYLKHQGKLPDRLDTPTIRKKWGFVSNLRR